jgi:dipeptidyl-peptidase-3
MPKRTVQSGDEDLIIASANNYYGEGVTEAEVDKFYQQMKAGKDTICPISYGLNSRLVKENGELVEKVWKVGGLYSAAIERIVSELQKALPFAENDAQKAIIEKLIEYYQTGDLKTFDAYSILWVEDTNSEVDFVNGFIETYGDPLGMKASWESTVNFINKEATKRTKVISDNAQWFEDHSPVDKRFKKEKVKGVSAKVITVSMLGGDCYPSTPIGINLPNADWIRRDHGSKSVTIENITDAYDKASQGNGFNEEFVWSDAERETIKKYGFVTDNLHTDLHECLGHGSGKLLPDTDPDALKAYSSTLEEARADLFGLYYLADKKLVKLGLTPNEDAYKAEYYKYIMNGLMTQLVRIEAGKNVEEAHMRNRQLIAKWAFEHGKSDNVIELKQREGKTYVVVNDYAKLRDLFGRLLAEVQRIKSEGDYAAGKQLVEDYGVKVDQQLHKEVLERYAALKLAPYKGFVNPRMQEVKNDKGEVVDIVLDYTETYPEQMLRYSRDYSFLPSYNN